VRADDHTVDHTVRCTDMLPSHRWRQRNAENVVNLLDDTRHLWLDNDMTTNNTTNALATLINDMINDRKAYATANGFTATDDEIAAHVRDSLIRMMSEAK